MAGKGLKSFIKGIMGTPDIRTMPVDEAIAIARTEPHLIPGKGNSEGYYVGGPRTIQNREDLDAMRVFLDDYVKADPRGGDWYDRYRAGVSDVTGGDARDMEWMTNIEGQYSAGVDPSSELGFALKDTNNMIAFGDPRKPARPAQAEASLRAAEANDPSLFQLGPKTGEYAKRVDPGRQDVVTATGVNDFRHLRNLGYTEVDGSAQKNAVGAAGHRFADYETALAVDRANQASVGGRSNWTGEQFQAAPWVRQKALDLLERGRNRYTKDAKEILKANGGDVSEEAINNMAYELAFEEANKTITDFFPKHTAYATHEAAPYGAGGHMEGFADLPKDIQDAFAGDSRSTWATAPGNRDAIYAGMRLGDTGYAVRTRPTQGMQGIYDGPNGIETNLGEVAMPLVDLTQLDPKGPKMVGDGSRAIMDLAESFRGLADYQGATPWHKATVQGISAPPRGYPDARIETSGGQITPDAIDQLSQIGAKYGLPDVMHTGDGLTMTDYSMIGPRQGLSTATLKNLARDVQGAVPDAKLVGRAKVDGSYPGYEGTWEQGVGSQAATRQFLDAVKNAPEGVVNALDQNPYISERVLARISRDKEFAAEHGLKTREDVQNLREILGSGPGFIGRLQEAVQKGAILPALGAAILAASQDNSPGA